jgi:hypothetical protein
MPGLMALLPLAPAYAAQPARPDPELLEFLGSIDSDEEGWQEFLDQMPLKAPRPAAAKPKPKQAPKPVASPPPEGSVPGTEAKPAGEAGKVKSQ